MINIVNRHRIYLVLRSWSTPHWSSPSNDLDISHCSHYLNMHKRKVRETWTMFELTNCTLVRAIHLCTTRWQCTYSPDIFVMLHVCLALISLLGLHEAWHLCGVVSRGTDAERAPAEDGRGRGWAVVLAQREQGSGEAEGPRGMRISPRFLYNLWAPLWCSARSRCQMKWDGTIAITCSHASSTTPLTNDNRF